MSEIKFPNPASRRLWSSLCGLDTQKASLLETLELLLAPARFLEWRERHHRRGLPLADFLANTWPLVVLEGDVGCGKSAMASSVGDPLAERLEAPVVLVEAPSDIRGSGLVGEIATRIAGVFRLARDRVPRSGYSLLLLDEGDDVGTSREQLQAHHEDRAGVNALIKELDLLAEADARVAVLLVTNRRKALDPALMRRAALTLHFDRPSGDALRGLWRVLLGGHAAVGRVEEVVKACERRGTFTYSDLVHRVGRAVVLRAFRQHRAVALEDVIAAIEETEPTPRFRDDGVVHPTA